jgi:molecular chaperone GrpE
VPFARRHPKSQQTEPSDEGPADELTPPEVARQPEATELGVEPSPKLHAGDEDGPERALESLTALHEKLDGVQRLLESRSGYEESMERSFKMLYEDLQEAQPNRVFELFRALYVDIILLCDRVEDLIDGEMEGDALRSVRDELLEVLARRGVEKIEVLGDEFDASVQRAVRRSPTSDRSLHGRVERRLRPGYRSSERIVRHQHVAVWGPREDTDSSA